MTLTNGSVRLLGLGPSPQLPRPSGAGACPTAFCTTTSHTPGSVSHRVPSLPAPHYWRASAAGTTASGEDLHETLPHWLPPTHLTLAHYAHVENCCYRSACASLPAPPLRRAGLKPAEAEVSRHFLRLSSGQRRRRRSGSGHWTSCPALGRRALLRPSPVPVFRDLARVMPRYCAAICCKNRRGPNNKDRKLSFYP